MKKQNAHPTPQDFADLMLLKEQQIQLLKKKYPLEILGLGVFILCIPTLTQMLLSPFFSLSTVEEALDTNGNLYQDYLHFNTEIQQQMSQYLAQFPGKNSIAPSSLLDKFNFLFKAAEDNLITQQNWIDIASYFLCKSRNYIVNTELSTFLSQYPCTALQQKSAIFLKHYLREVLSSLDLYGADIHYRFLVHQSKLYWDFFQNNPLIKLIHFATIFSLSSFYRITSQFCYLADAPPFQFSSNPALLTPLQMNALTMKLRKENESLRLSVRKGTILSYAGLIFLLLMGSSSPWDYFLCLTVVFLWQGFDKIKDAFWAYALDTTLASNEAFLQRAFMHYLSLNQAVKLYKGDTFQNCYFVVFFKGYQNLSPETVRRCVQVILFEHKMGVLAEEKSSLFIRANFHSDDKNAQKINDHIEKVLLREVATRKLRQQLKFLVNELKDISVSIQPKGKTKYSLSFPTFYLGHFSHLFSEQILKVKEGNLIIESSQVLKQSMLDNFIRDINQNHTLSIKEYLAAPNTIESHKIEKKRQKKTAVSLTKTAVAPVEKTIIKWTSAHYNPQRPKRVQPLPNTANKFVFFALKADDFASKKTYQAFKTAAYEKGEARNFGDQGIVSCAQIARDSRTNKQFFANVKVKLLGSNGDARVYGHKETTFSEGTKKTLYVFRGYQQHTH